MAAQPAHRAIHILGSINLDSISRLDRLPRPGDTVIAWRTTTGAGGKGANQAVAAARFGATVALHGAVGDDPAGHALRARLADEGVDVAAVAAHADAATGGAQVMVADDGENMIVIDPGANRLARAPSAPAAGAVLLAQLETPVDEAAAMFAAAGPERLCLLNAAPALAEGRCLLPLADIVILNEGELAFYAGDAGDAAVKAQRLLAQSGATRRLRHIIVTLGAAGAVIVDPARATTLPGHPAEVVDTTGAGDCFVGVFAAALAHGSSVFAAAALANRAAAYSVGRLGADCAPFRHEVEATG